MGRCTASHCGRMPGQESLRGRSLCVVYCLARWLSRRLAKAVRLVHWRRVRICNCFFRGCFGGMVRVDLLCVLSLGAKGG